MVLHRTQRPQSANAALSSRRLELRMQKPVWHAPWKLMRVISGHLGWVRSLAIEPANQWFASGAGDRIIKASTNLIMLFRFGT